MHSLEVWHFDDWHCQESDRSLGMHCSTTNVCSLGVHSLQGPLMYLLRSCLVGTDTLCGASCDLVLVGWSCVWVIGFSSYYIEHPNQIVGLLLNFKRPSIASTAASWAVFWEDHRYRSVVKKYSHILLRFFWGEDPSHVYVANQSWIGCELVKPVYFYFDFSSICCSALNFEVRCAMLCSCFTPSKAANDPFTRHHYFLEIDR